MFRFSRVLFAAAALALIAVGFGTTPAGTAIAQTVKSTLVEVVNVPDVNVVNNPPVQAQQSGSWNVGVNGTVQVGNPATNPLFVRDADKAARTAFLETCSINVGFSGLVQCDVTVVPPGKVLVVEMYSGSVSVGGAAAIVRQTLLEFQSTGVLGSVPVVHTVPVLMSTSGTTRTFVFTQSARAYLPAGTDVKAQVYSVFATSQSATFSVYGYLVDCGSGPGCPIP
jgi:hypothetical protein